MANPPDKMKGHYCRPSREQIVQLLEAGMDYSYLKELQEAKLADSPEAGYVQVTRKGMEYINGKR